MKEQDVRIGMKVVPHDKTAGQKGLKKSTIWEVAKDDSLNYLYVRGKDEGAFILSNKENYGIAERFNACDFEPYINISDTQRLERLEKFIQQSPYEGILLIPVATPSESYLQLAGVIDVDYDGYDTLLEGKTLRGVLDKLEELSKNTEKERLEEEIQKAFEEHVKKYGNDFSLFSCYKAGYIAGREGK